MQHLFRRFLSGMIILFVLSGTFALAKEKYVTPEDIIPILDEIDALNKRIDALYQKHDEKKLPEASQRLLDLLKKDMAELSEVLERVETKSIVDRLEIGAEIRTRLDWYTFRGHDNLRFTNEPTTRKLHEQINLQPSNRFRLNLRANISDNLKFTSRLVMLRHWSDDDFPVYPDVNFLNTTRVPGDINLKVERAYVDYFFSPLEKLPMAFTFGRLPSTDGLPTDFRENTPRKSTYPAIAYNVESDGLGFSLDLEPLTHLPQTAARFIFSLRYDDNEKYFMGKLLSEKSGVYRVDEESMDPIHFCVFQLETHIPDFFGGLLAIFNVLYIPKAGKPDFRYTDELAAFYDDDPFLGTQGEDSLGYLTKYTLFVESKELLGFNFDWFAGISYMKTHAKGALEFMVYPREAGQPFDPVPARQAYENFDVLVNEKGFGELASVYDTLKNSPPPIGLLNYNGFSDREGHCIHVGGRANLPLKIKNCPKVGIEYNHGSKYWMNFGEASEDPLHKLSTRGEVWDFYILQPISRYFMLRIGHTVTRHDYDQNLSFYYGEPLVVDHNVTNTYFLMDAKF
ncbi:MAG: DUF3373 family protein [Candidatus Magnetomorum sp.]|nr:DUF3373 family protein [Candidatus Magnetomorum sp.]